MAATLVGLVELVALSTIAALLTLVAHFASTALVALFTLASVLNAFTADLMTGLLLGTRHGLLLVLAVLVKALAAVGFTATRAALLSQAGD